MLKRNRKNRHIRLRSVRTCEQMKMINIASRQPEAAMLKANTTLLLQQKTFNIAVAELKLASVLPWLSGSAMGFLLLYGLSHGVSSTPLAASDFFQHLFLRKNF